MDRDFAARFAADWVAAWNAHDLDRVLGHYADDFEMTSPVMIQLGIEASGTLKGKAAVAAYWRKALQWVPDLHFELLDTLVGVHSITLYYQGARGRVAEVFHFGAGGKVMRASAYYGEPAAVPVQAGE